MTASQLDNVADVYPLTPMQQGMLFHALADREGSVFVNQMIIEVSGELDVPSVRAVLEGLLQRHETLRTAFLWDGLDQPLQVVRETVELDWQEHDWRSLGENDREKHLGDFLDRDRRVGFDLAEAPLTRVSLIRLTDQSWAWIWTTHHLVADGWSMQVVLSELFAELRGVATHKEPSFRFREYVAFQSGRDESADESYWRSLLAGFAAPHRLEVPGLPANGVGHLDHTVTLASEVSDALRDFARSERVTLNTVFLGAWALVLSRWMRSRDVVFGVTSSGRDAQLPGIENAVGLFINTLPVRVDVAPTAQLGTWLRSLQQRQLESRAFEQTSLASVQRWSDVPAGVPLFESIFVFENLPTGDRSLATSDLTFVDTAFVEHSNYPLAVLVHPDDRIEVQFIFDRSRLSASAVGALATQVEWLVSQLPHTPEVVLGRLDLVSVAEAARLVEWESGADLPGDERLIHNMIAEAAEQDPDAIAVIFEDRNMTYGELLAGAQRVAARLSATSVGPSRLVGLFMPRSIEMVVGMLGILQAGAAYVPLDPSYPADHLNVLMDTDGIDVVVSDAGHSGAIPKSKAVVMVDDDSPLPTVWEASSPSPDDYAYVIHTSGSTGRPKGVAVSHKNLVSSTLARFDHYRAPVGRFLLLSSFSFDSSVAGLFWTLCSGGALVLPRTGQEHDAEHLLSLVADHRVSHTLCLPSLYGVLLEQDERRRLSTMDVVVVAGEAASPDLAATHRSHSPRVELHNEYGPTEATVWCTVHKASVADEGRSMSIGRPIAGSRVYLLDEFGNRAPAGFVGEIAVAGVGLTDGYLNRSDLTAERFVTLDISGRPERLYRTGDLGCFTEQGELRFLGRADSQLKIRGHRVEPTAVESSIRSHPRIDEAAVASRLTPSGSTSQLVAFVTGTDIELASIRSHLTETLPGFMVPDVVVEVDAMPRLPNGKVDYSKLVGAAPAADQAEILAPRDDVEAKMAELWAAALGIDESAVGSNSDYFALGGDSLLAIRLMSAVRREFGPSLPLATILEAPRLSDFCRRLTGGGGDESEVIVPIGVGGPDSVFLVHPGGGNVLVYEPLARNLPSSIRPVAVQARGIDGTTEPDETVEQMGQRYATEIDQFLPTGQVHLVGYSTGGLVAYETAQVLREMGREVGLVVLLDTLYPLGRTLGTRIARQLRTVRTGGWKGLREVAWMYWATLRSLAGKMRHGPKWIYERWRGRSLSNELAGKRINHIAIREQRKYQPKPYSGRVIYIRASNDDSLMLESSVSDWSSISDRLRLRKSPGYHTGPESLLSERNSVEVAAIIAEELAASNMQEHVG